MWIEYISVIEYSRWLLPRRFRYLHQHLNSHYLNIQREYRCIQIKQDLLISMCTWILSTCPLLPYLSIKPRVSSESSIVRLHGFDHSRDSKFIVSLREMRIDWLIPMLPYLITVECSNNEIDNTRLEWLHFFIGGEKESLFFSFHLPNKHLCLQLPYSVVWLLSVIFQTSSFALLRI